MNINNCLKGIIIKKSIELISEDAALFINNKKNNPTPDRYRDQLSTIPNPQSFRTSFTCSSSHGVLPSFSLLNSYCSLLKITISAVV